MSLEISENKCKKIKGLESEVNIFHISWMPLMALTRKFVLQFAYFAIMLNVEEDWKEVLNGSDDCITWGFIRFTKLIALMNNTTHLCWRATTNQGSNNCNWPLAHAFCESGILLLEIYDTSTFHKSMFSQMLTFFSVLSIALLFDQFVFLWYTICKSKSKDRNNSNDSDWLGIILLETVIRKKKQQQQKRVNQN